MMNEKFIPMGMCWLLERCDWWNPTLKMICDGIKINPCIKCWEFKNIPIEG